MQVEFDDIKKEDNIIDIRSKLEFEDNHLPKCINIPKLMLMSKPEVYLNKNDKYYLLCDKGIVSLSCTKILNALGYKCFSINGGIENIKKLKK